MKRISVGVIGCGAMGTKHIGNFTKIAEVKEVCVSDRSKDRLNSIKRKYGVSKTYTDYEELIDYVDAVCVSTPNLEHFKHASRAMEAGRDLLVEKPMATNSLEAKKLVEEAERKKLVLAVGFQKRFNVKYQELRETVLNGTIGKPVFVRARSISLGPYRLWKAVSDWYYSTQSASGALIDTGSHMIDLIFWVYPHPLRKVAGALLGKTLNLPVEEYAFCVLEMENNVGASLEVGWFTKQDETLEVLGTAGRVEARQSTQGFFQSLANKIIPAKDEWYFQDQTFVASCIRGTCLEPLATSIDGYKSIDAIERIYGSTRN